MAGVYPVGMKMAAGWANRDLGLLVGLLVGALTLGSAAPAPLQRAGRHRLALHTIGAASALAAVVSALLINFVALGPNHGRAARFRAIASR